MMNVAIGCMVKCENLYLEEWVRHHLAIGFEHIYIYDNNERDGERPQDVLQSYIDNDKVTVIDFRGRSQTSCQVQVLAYNNCYYRFGSKYDWMIFLDIDEFIVLKQHDTVQEYLSEPFFRNVQSIRINWLCYSGNGHVKYDPRPVRGRFTVPCKKTFVNQTYKAFIRTKIPGLHITNVHYTSELSSVCMDNGTPIPYTNSAIMRETDYSLAYIAHYVTKSMEEYVKVKRARRGSGRSKDRLSIDFYFRYNERTPERERLLQKIFAEKTPMIEGGNY